MKLLLALSLLIGMQAAGQKDTTFLWRSNPDSGYGLLLSSGYLRAVDSVVIKYDTVRVVMLVCDTQWSTQTYSYSNTKYDIDFTIDLSKIVRWQFGYEVRKWNQGQIIHNGDGWCPSCPDYYTHVSYLDDRRRPLSKSIIVWQSIKL